MTNKKYRLIKEYPGSVKLGTTNEYIISDCYRYPEFWEEVIEKDYEILTWYSPSGILENRIHSTYDSFHTQIHSVKRLFDGEVFTIGDLLDEKSFTKNSRHSLIENPKDLYDNKITKIAIVKNHDGEVAGYTENQNGKLMFSASNKWNNLNVLLTNAIKFKQPLFITEDKVEIFVGDEFYFVTEELLIGYGKAMDKNIRSYAKHFSNKEYAKKYIFLNKPCLSLQDVANIYVSAAKEITDTTSYTAQNRRIQDLVKEKLKL